MRTAGYVAAFVWLCAGAAFAQPGGVSGVSGVAILQGALKVEARTAVFEGGAIDGGWIHRAQASYGVIDWWRTQINFRAAQRDDEDAELRSVGWENAVDFTATRDWPIRLGGQAEYRWGVNGAADSFELKLLAEHRAEDFNARFNLIAGRDVGNGAADDWEHSYAARTLWTLGERFQLGAEGFGELDIDAHAWGPRAGIAIGPATLSAGYLLDFGDDSEADGQLRLSLEISP